MDEAVARVEEQVSGPETPEDVAILYSWANLPGAKYRDFSASRREYRAQQRAKAAEAQRQAELAAAREMELATQREIEEAQRQLEETKRAEAQAAADAEDKKRAEDALRLAEERAEQERQEIRRREESAEDLRQQAERAREEMREARKRSEEQASRYTETRAHVRTRTESGPRTVPGEITDPYYYSGHVDPAYFASTPGVRTAQAARVSTERRAYVYPVHPGSDEFDSGTVNAFRSGNHFAPSPVQTFTVRTEPIKEERRKDVRVKEEQGPIERSDELRAEAAETIRPRPIRFTEESDSRPANLDAEYYNNGPALGSLPGREDDTAPATLDTALPDLHIRPATRAGSGEHDRYIPPPRRSPLPNLSVPDPRPTRFAAAALPPQRAELLHAEGLHLGRPAPLRVAPVANRPYQTERRIADRTPPSPLRYDAAENETFDDGRSSRMFIPSPRRRVMGLPVLEERPIGPAGEPSATQARSRDEAAALGEQRSYAETASREADDLFVRRQEVGAPNTVLPGDDRSQGRGQVTTEPTSEVRSTWREGSRSGESSFRKRREGTAEPAARTFRQQRIPREPERLPVIPVEDEASQPAWLSTERPAVSRADVQSVGAGDAFSPDAPPSDKSLPGDSEQADSVASAGATTPHSDAAWLSRTADTTAPLEKAPERWRGAADLRTPSHTGDDSASDTLQQSRERVASRWFALGGIMGSEDRRSLDQRNTAPRPAPLLSVLSISGGVGKTSIVATLGRALSSMGEKVLLVDTHVHGILPYYFGARDQRLGALRTFTPPPGSADAPVVLVSYDADTRGHDPEGQSGVVDDLQRRANETQRVLLDVGVNSAWLVRKLAVSNPWVLVPVAADMNSVIGTQAVERLFRDITDANGTPVKPYYVLNQYDATMPLHLDVREVMRQFLGERLLPIVLHRTPAVSEALAEGMTVIDYAPGTPIAEDYMNLAAWVRGLAESGISYARPARWSER